jgi:hypothetical protein
MCFLPLARLPTQYPFFTLMQGAVGSWRRPTVIRLSGDSGTSAHAFQLLLGDGCENMLRWNWVCCKQRWKRYTNANRCDNTMKSQALPLPEQVCTKLRTHDPIPSGSKHEWWFCDPSSADVIKQGLQIDHLNIQARKFVNHIEIRKVKFKKRSKKELAEAGVLEHIPCAMA